MGLKVRRVLTSRQLAKFKFALFIFGIWVVTNGIASAVVSAITWDG